MHILSDEEDLVKEAESESSPSKWVKFMPSSKMMRILRALVTEKPVENEVYDQLVLDHHSDAVFWCYWALICLQVHALLPLYRVQFIFAYTLYKHTSEP